MNKIDVGLKTMIFGIITCFLAVSVFFVKNLSIQLALLIISLLTFIQAIRTALSLYKKGNH